MIIGKNFLSGRIETGLKSGDEYLLKRISHFIILICLPLFCGVLSGQKLAIRENQNQETIETKILPPQGFKRIPVNPGSFADWLRKLSLLSAGSPVLDYRSRVFKSPVDTTVAAVISMDVSGRKLWQCMDILIVLHTEYLLRKGKRHEVSGLLPDGTLLSWKQWSHGFRSDFAGVRYSIHKKASADSTEKNFYRYLNHLFELSGTQAFYHFYPTIDPKELQIGDFIVKKGNKGHAVMIMDLAVDQAGKLLALIGQGDTPACQFYILNYRKDNPWFPIDITTDKLPLPIKKEMFWQGLRRFPD